MIKNKNMHKYLLLSVNVFITGSLLCANVPVTALYNNPSGQVQVPVVQDTKSNTNEQKVNDNKEVVTSTEEVKKSSIVADTKEKEEATIAPVTKEVKVEAVTVEKTQPTGEADKAEKKDEVVKQDSSLSTQAQAIVPAIQDVSVEEKKEEDTEVVVSRGTAAKENAVEARANKHKEEKKQLFELLGNHTAPETVIEKIKAYKDSIFGKKSAQAPWQEVLDALLEVSKGVEARNLIKNIKDALINDDFEKVDQLCAEYNERTKELIDQANIAKRGLGAIQSIRNKKREVVDLKKYIASAQEVVALRAQNADLVAKVFEFIEYGDCLVKNRNQKDSLYSLEEFNKMATSLEEVIRSRKKDIVKRTTSIDKAAAKLKSICLSLGITDGDLHPKDIYGDDYNSNADVAVNMANTGSAVVEENQTV